VRRVKYIGLWGGREVVHTVDIFQPISSGYILYNENIMKNHIYKVSGLILSVSLIMPLFAAAQTDSSTALQIQSLMSQITSLEQQLHTLMQSVASSSNSDKEDGGMGRMGTTTPPNVSNMMGEGGMSPKMGVCPVIARDLYLGVRGDDVSQLQGMLAREGFLSGATTTGYFGPMTARALGEFQKQSGIASSTGFFGPITRDFLRGHCGDGSGMMGSSTPPNMMPMQPVWHEGSTTSQGQGSGDWNVPPMMGSTTMPQPCPQNPNTLPNNSNPAAAAAALFVPHALIPGMIIEMHPCPPSSNQP